MIDRLRNNERELIMKEAFRRASSDIIFNEDRFKKPQGRVKIGLEMECSVVGQEARQVTEEERNNLTQAFPTFADVELGAAQIEWRTDPFQINEPSGLSSLVAQAQKHDLALHREAVHQDIQIIRSGTNPFIPINEIKRTNKLKYQQVPDFHNTNRTRQDTVIGCYEGVNVGDAAVVALLNSLQCNIEAASFAHAVDMLNRSLMIGPMVVALSGNSRFLAGTDTGFNDVRMPVWEVSHDVRNDQERARGNALRVGMPTSFFYDLGDYFQRAGSHPFILFDPDHALQIGVGLFWQDTRIKVIADSLVVEFRPVSIQPTVEEDLAVMLFYTGRLLWSEQVQEEIVPIETVRHLRNQAMSFGMRMPEFSQEQLFSELARARVGLHNASVDTDLAFPLLDILQKRVCDQMTPSDRTARVFQQAITRGVGRKQALQIALQVQ